ERALQSAERAKTLVSRMLGFARRQALEARALDLGELVEGMRELVASSVGSTVTITTSVPSSLPPVHADANQLEVAVLNLCINARDAMPEGGRIMIAAAVAGELPAGLAPRRHGFVRLSVSDSGTGMDGATLARAIEPFFSTKDVGKGTGLGLSMVHGFANQSEGAFVLSSELGKGTCANLYLPISAAAVESQPMRPAASAAAAQIGRAHV